METAYRMDFYGHGEYYLVEGNNSYCDQFVRRGSDFHCLMDQPKGEIFWYSTDYEFFETLERDYGRSPEHLIDLDFETYIEFLFGILEVDNRSIRCN